MKRPKILRWETDEAGRERTLLLFEDGSIVLFKLSVRHPDLHSISRVMKRWLDEIRLADMSLRPMEEMNSAEDLTKPLIEMADQ